MSLAAVPSIGVSKGENEDPWWSIAFARERERASESEARIGRSEPMGGGSNVFNHANCTGSISSVDFPILFGKELG